MTITSLSIIWLVIMSFVRDPCKYNKNMKFPIPIKTNHGVVHLYCKLQRPIIGTDMLESKFAVTIVTETKNIVDFWMKKY